MDFGGRKIEEGGGVGESFEFLSRLFAVELRSPGGDLGGVGALGELDGG